jgi:RNA-binding protein YlmH
MENLTAVEWLVEQIESYEIKTDIFNSMYFNVPKRMIEQAKAMEKEQIKNAYWNGTTDMEKEDALLMGEDYFNEYYKK